MTLSPGYGCRRRRSCEPQRTPGQKRQRRERLRTPRQAHPHRILVCCATASARGFQAGRRCKSEHHGQDNAGRLREQGRTEAREREARRKGKARREGEGGHKDADEGDTQMLCTVYGLAPFRSYRDSLDQP